MKIGILTFHYARNYGATLQAYCLQEVLKSLGYKVCILDYRNPYLAHRKSPFSFNSFITNPVKYFQRLINIYYGYKKTVRNFKKFEKEYMNVEGNCLKESDIQDSDCDVLVVGSDQVWSPIITNGPDSVYWGMKRPKRSKLITYAASSCDTVKLSIGAFTNVSEWLNNFDAISVREERLKVYVESQIDKDVKVVVDPTILAGRETLEKVTAGRVINEPYVLLYHVESSPSLLKVARLVAKKHNARLVSIAPYILSARLNNKDILYYQADVSEMLSLIKYAECVVALSFHGTALSVLYEKEFYSVVGGNMARVESLLGKIGLMDRIVKGVDDVSFQKIQYKEHREKISELQSDSLEWLKRETCH